MSKKLDQKTLIAMIKQEIKAINESRGVEAMHIQIQNELEELMQRHSIDLGGLEGIIMDMKDAAPAQAVGFPKISDFGATPEQIASLKENWDQDMPPELANASELIFQAAEIIGEHGSHPELTEAYLTLMRVARDNGLNINFLMMSL